MTVEVAREALLADARAEAERELADADLETRERIDEARRAADALIARARAKGEAEGRIDAARGEAQQGTLARLEVLGAQGSVYQELRRRSRTDVLSLRHEPAYRQLLERLAGAARRDLGGAAELELDPPDAGGVRGRVGTRSVDYTLPTIAERCVDHLGLALRRLWE